MIWMSRDVNKAWKRQGREGEKTGYSTEGRSTFVTEMVGAIGSRSGGFRAHNFFHMSEKNGVIIN